MLRRYFMNRILQVPLALLVVSITIFLIVRAAPGDPVQIMLGMQTSPESAQALREEFRLDQPVHIQYVLWMGDLLQGNFGRSIRLNTPVLSLLAERFPVSIFLAIGAMLFAFVISIPLGLIAALKRNSWVDYLATGYTLVGFAVPNFALAMVLIYVFSLKLGWFPITGAGSPQSLQSGVWSTIKPFILPAVALGTLQAAVFTRLLRSSMIDVLSNDYMRTAQAKGLSGWTIIMVHALKNAMIPYVTMSAIQFGYLIGIQVTIEHIFAIPGVGTAILGAVVSRDFPVVQGFVMVIAAIVLLMNILADALYVMFDPRIRL